MESKENNIPNEKMSSSRGENWTQEEKINITTGGDIDPISPSFNTPKVKFMVKKKKRDTPRRNFISKAVVNMMKEEHKLKVNYLKQELTHQQLRHKLEIELLIVEKEKKNMEIELLKKKLQE